jgi:hypothetical protein
VSEDSQAPRNTTGPGDGTARAAPPPPVRLIELLAGSWVARAISAAARLGISDLLADGPRSTSELAAGTGTEELALHRLLRALSGVGVFTEVSERRFALTELGNLLRTGIPGSQRARALMAGASWEWDTWRELDYSLKTGAPAFDHVFGTDFFSFLAQDADAATMFNEMMTGVTGHRSAAILDAYDFPTVGTLVDVGGGHGSFAASALAAHPGMHGVIFDQPGVVAGAQARLEAAGVADRCRLVAGDFFESVPTGGDVYTLISILHNWDDERAVAILRSCRQAVADGARLLVCEWVILPGNEPSLGKLLDLQMLVLFGGRTRTLPEFTSLFADAGFEVTGLIRTRAGISIVEGSPR